jgi:hypothetical protein
MQIGSETPLAKTPPPEGSVIADLMVQVSEAQKQVTCILLLTALIAIPWQEAVFLSVRQLHTKTQIDQKAITFNDHTDLTTDICRSFLMI